MTVTITLAKDAPEDAVAVIGLTPDDLGVHRLGQFLRDGGFGAKAGEYRVVPANGADGDDVGVEIVVGLGADDDRTLDDVRKTGAAIARAAAKYASVVVDVPEPPADVTADRAAQALAEGIVLGDYAYTALKTEPEARALEAVTVVGRGGKKVQAALDLGAAIGASTNVARDLVNEPGGSLTAPAYAKRVEQLGSEHGFEVTVLGPKEIKAARMGGVLGVNRGSELPPRFVELRWAPANPRGVVALVGKGITFDSGGLSLKPSDAMMGMKGDMGGSAAIVGAFCAVAALNPRVEVRGYLPMTDNMTGGDATRLGDVLKISNGKTVEIHNTDAEGRLILADGLSRASAEGPDAIVDLATLTGACMVALGPDHAGVFANDDGWAEQVLAAGATAGEKSWRLPLPPEWRKQLDSDIADIKNVGGRYGGASTAALFLQEFVGEGIPWVHLDIAGPSMVDAESVLERKGATGYGVRTLLALLKAYRKP